METYVIEKKIGVGSYGTAYLVHLKSDRYAIYAIGYAHHGVNSQQ
jgi:hypothetical protein